MDLVANLKTFLRVAQTASFSAVASERGLTQPAISRQISALEEHFHTRLVQRSTQAVTLTDEGRTLLEAAQRLVDDADALHSTLSERQGKVIGRVRLAIPVGLGLFLSSRLKPLLHRHPDLSIDFFLCDDGVNLIDEGLDLQIRLGPVEDTALICRVIGQTTAYLVASPEYVAANPPLSHPADLHHHDCIVHPCGPQDSTWLFRHVTDEQDEIGEIAISINGRIRANNAATAYLAALSGAGVSQQSDFAVSEDLQAGRLRHILPEYSCQRNPIYLLYSSRRIMPPRTIAVIEYLTTLLGEVSAAASKMNVLMA